MSKTRDKKQTEKNTETLEENDVVYSNNISMLDEMTLHGIVQIIDLAASKGVFSGNDLFNVGLVRSKVLGELQRIEEYRKGVMGGIK